MAHKICVPFFMAKIVNTLSDAVKKINTLYNTSSTPPNAGEEDYLIWTDLICTAINLWENEEGMLWRQLFVKLADAPDGTKTTTTALTYAVPSLFRFPNSAYVWLGTGTQQIPFKVVRQEDIQLLENDTGNWCYFLLSPTPTLIFNPNLTMTSGLTISYNYYKYATAVSAATDVIEMSDPMYTVYYTISELKKEEGDVTALSIANQKLEAMKTLEYMAAKFQTNDTRTPVGAGFGTVGNNPNARG